SIVAVPWIAGRGVLDVEIDLHFEHGAAHPGAKALPERGEYFVLQANDLAFADDFAECGSAVCHLDRSRANCAAGVVNELLAEPGDPRAQIAKRAKPAGRGIDVRFEEFIADCVSLGSLDARLSRRRASRTARQPNVTERRDIDHQPGHAIAELGRLDGIANGNRRGETLQFEGRSPRETAWIKDHHARLVLGRAYLQAD